MRSRSAKVGEVEHQWKPRRNRMIRKWRGEGQRRMQGLSAKIIKLLEDDDMNGRTSPCSVVSFSLSLDNRFEDTHGNSEWIRTTHIRNTAVNEYDRRSPLFTGRMLRRNDSRQMLLSDYPSEDSRNCNTSRPHIRDRLEPPVYSNLRRLESTEFNVPSPPDFNIPPRSERSEIDIHHRLESSNMRIYQRNEEPVAVRSREHIDVAGPPEQVPYHHNQQENEITPPHLHSRGFMRDQYNGYNTDRFSRNQFSHPQRPRGFRRSLYYPPGYVSPSNEDTVKQPRSRWPWLETAIKNSENHPDYIDHDRQETVDYNVKRFGRDIFSPPGQRNYERPQYDHPRYLDYRGYNLNGSRSEMSLSSHEMKNYFEYRPEAYEMNYNDDYNQRDDGWYNWSVSQGAPYGPSDSPRRFYSSRPLPYSAGSSHPAHNAMMDTPQYRNLNEPPSRNWDGPGHNNQFSCTSDEDFSDSDQLDSDTEKSEDNSKKRVRQMWKKLVKETGILVSRDGATAAMTREHAEHVKKSLLEKASGSTFYENWKPSFLRTGLVQRSGLYQIICKDYPTVTWTLKQEIPPFDGNGFKILKRPYDWDCGPVRISLWLSSEPSNPEETLKSLDAENPGIGATSWRLVSISVEDGWRHLIADVSREAALYLETNGWTILYWNSLLPVTRIRNASNQLFMNQLAGDNP